MLRQLGAIKRHLAGNDRHRRMRVDKKAVTKAGGAAHRGIAVGGDPDRRVRLLHRAAGHRDIGELADLVFKGDVVLGP